MFFLRSKNPIEYTRSGIVLVLVLVQPFKMKCDGHQRKQQTNDYGIGHTHRFDDAIVFWAIHPQ
jgi:hypothetical protein